MTCKSFFCDKCQRRIPIAEGRDAQSAIRQHYWDNHRQTMMKGAKKRSRKR